jgi:hypothetical protein
MLSLFASFGCERRGPPPQVQGPVEGSAAASASPAPPTPGLVERLAPLGRVRLLDSGGAAPRIELTLSPSLDLIIDRLPESEDPNPQPVPDEVFIGAHMVHELHQEPIDAGVVRIHPEHRLEPAFIFLAGAAIATRRRWLLAHRLWAFEETQREVERITTRGSDAGTVPPPPPPILRGVALSYVEAARRVPELAKERIVSWMCTDRDGCDATVLAPAIVFLPDEP